MTSEAKGVREAADEIPYDHEVWADLIRKNQALAMNVHVDDMLRVAQAANQSDTQYYVAPDVEEACALRVADVKRLNSLDELYPFLVDTSNRRVLLRLRGQRDVVLSICLMLVLPWLLWRSEIVNTA